MDAMIAYTPDWSSLPEHLLAFIAKGLHARFDILRFRAVCRLFRSILPPPPKFLFKAPFFRDSIPYVDVPYFLSKCTVYAIQPLNNETSQTWLFKIKESEPGRVQLRDLVCISPFNLFKSLPKNFPRSLNLLDYRVTEITKSYKLESVAPCKGLARYSFFAPEYPFSAKVICTSSLDKSNEGFAVMVHFKFFLQVTVWTNIDKKWTHIDVGVESPEDIVDIIYHNGKFYVLFSLGRIVDVDPKSLTVTVVADPPEFLFFWSLYMVESIKDLILIARDKDRNNEEDCYIKVFKLDEEKHEWVRVVDGLGLEDRVIFLSGRNSCSVSAKEFSGWKGNCVYFKGDGKNREDPGYDAWIYDLKDNEAEKLPDFLGFETTWLKQGSCSAGCQ